MVSMALRSKVAACVHSTASPSGLPLMLTLQRCVVSHPLQVLGGRHRRRVAHPLEQTSSKRASDISTISKSCLMVEAYARGASALHGSVSMMTLQRRPIILLCSASKMKLQPLRQWGLSTLQLSQAGAEFEVIEASFLNLAAECGVLHTMSVLNWTWTEREVMR